MKSIQQKSGHTKWECKYHIVWIPKYRKKKLYKELRQYLGKMLRDLAIQKECTIEEGHLMSDHVHMLVSIPPKYSVAQIVGFLKGKSAISIARTYFGRRKNFTGQHFWARGYHVSTVGRDEVMIREYIRHQTSGSRRPTYRSVGSILGCRPLGGLKQSALSGSYLKPPALPEVVTRAYRISGKGFTFY